MDTLEQFDAHRPFGPWARRIATRVAVDYLKSIDARQLSGELFEPAQPAGQDPALQAEMREQIARAFFSLPARLRVAASLALIEECPYPKSRARWISRSAR